MKYSFLRLFTLIFSAAILLSSCNEDPVLESKTFNYQFHNGQTVPSAPYAGYHNSNLTASMKIDELEDGGANITVTLENTLDGEAYHMHAHDAADPSTTTNGTPYNESPNSDVFATMVQGNGGSVSTTLKTDMSYSEITSTYDGFFVIHDPLQAINTADITSYLIVAAFARDQQVENFESATFNYDFNTGQVAEAFQYVGTHPTNFTSSIRVDELADGRSRVTVTHMNTVDGLNYATHAHDMADPSTTMNGTPYIETPNGAIFAGGIIGNGGMNGKANISDMSFADITTSYDGFFVTHDPLQDIDTTNPATYVILGVFAR